MTKIFGTSYAKNWHQALRKKSWDSGSGKNLSRIQGSEKHQIKDPDPRHYRSVDPSQHSSKARDHRWAYPAFLHGAISVTQTWSEGLDDLKNAAGGVCGAVSLSSGCFFFMPVTGRKLPSFRSIPNIGYRSRFDVMITKY